MPQKSRVTYSHEEIGALMRLWSQGKDTPDTPKERARAKEARRVAREFWAEESARKATFRKGMNVRISRTYPQATIAGRVANVLDLAPKHRVLVGGGSGKAKFRIAILASFLTPVKAR